MANLQEFMKKVGKLSKKDYTIKVSPVATYTRMSTQFEITLIDYNRETKQYKDYKDREKVDELIEWLNYYYDENTSDYIEDNEDNIFYFNADNFAVVLNYLSNQEE